MRIGEIRVLIEQRSDEELVFAPWFDKDEADEHMINNMEMEESEKLTAEEWQSVVNWLGNDDGVWEELYESFRYYLEKVIALREKGEADVNSK